MISVNWIAVAGTLAAACSMISFIPQAWRIVKSRDTSSISPIGLLLRRECKSEMACSLARSAEQAKLAALA
ncbi:hypothetical protein ASE66_24695 [Bosea sp. Root483D1]|uniref:PQ-loop repeat-containing protein n=1 Tax=Bosea sp. Root483D1 TaxID=1736544 RepID=UPI00070C5E2D|nr:PQ-loop repeat-containing protein [Bosea sp. Root483D1]KRE11712.1 hypothetical protein ASE66_24695 [Bosea sp. Root483D1]